MNKEEIIRGAKYVAESKFKTNDFNQLSNEQLIDVVAHMIADAHDNPNVEVISEKLQTLMDRQQRLRGR